MLLNQLREITGIQDPSFLHEALKVSFKASMSQQVLDSCSYHSCVSSSYFYAKMKVHMYRDRSSRGQMTQYLQPINYKSKKKLRMKETVQGTLQRFKIHIN